MAIAIEVEVAPLTDMEIEWGNVSIVTEVDHQTDIGIEVFHGGESQLALLERSIATASLSVDGAAGTYSQAFAAGNNIKYLVFGWSQPTNWTGTVTMTYEDGATVISPTIVASANFGWFGTADGDISLGYYIGSDIPASGTMKIVRSSPAASTTGNFRIWAGTAFGNVALLSSWQATAAGTFGGNGYRLLDPLGKVMLPFAVCSPEISIIHSLSVVDADPRATMQPDSLTNAAVRNVGISNGKGAMGCLALTDDANSTTEITLAAEDDKSMIVVVDHLTDMTVEIDGTRVE